MNRDIKVIGASALTLAALSFTLWYDFTHTARRSGVKPIGEHIQRTASTERRLSSQVVWDDLDVSDIVYNEDTIRTGAQSGSVIRLKDGTLIKLAENSMIVLVMADEIVQLEMKEGSIEAKRQTGSSGEIQMRVNDRTTTVKDGDISLTRTGESGVEVEVRSGSAVVSSGTETVNVEAGRTAKTEDEKITVHVSPILRLPENQTILNIENEQASVDFSWDSANLETRLEISSGTDFRDANHPAAGTGGGRVNLSPGQYWWRLQYKSGGTTYEATEARALIVKQIEKPRLVVPGDGDKINGEPEASINFLWSNSQEEIGQVEVAADAGFQHIVWSASSQTKNLLHSFPAWDYFWRVKSTAGDISVYSRVNRFSIQKPPRDEPPELVRPSMNQIFGFPAQPEGMVLAWSAGRSNNKFELWISTDADFKINPSKIITMESFYSLASPEEGTYYWKVRNIGGLEPSEFSQTRRFSLRKYENPELSAPGAGEAVFLDEIPAQGLPFRWDLPVPNAVFLFTLRSGGSVVKQERVNGTGLYVRGLGQDDYTWDVELIDASGRSLSKASREFRIFRSPGSPVMAEPAPAQVVDLTDKNELQFSWRKTPDAEFYILKVFKMENNRPVQIASQRTDELSYVHNDLPKLDVGQFRWSLQAFRTVGGREYAGPVSTGNFSIYIKPLDAPRINMKKRERPSNQGPSSRPPGNDPLPETGGSR